MQTYLVGGAVRDELLGFTSQDKDFVVVGSTPEQMLAAGFRPVGKDLPTMMNMPWLALSARPPKAIRASQFMLRQK
jgi:tRNA nucleotidyltransferase/poly(A) polymerase